MAFHMLNMQRYKAQFYVLTAVFLVSLFFLFSSLFSIKELSPQKIVKEEFLFVRNLEIEFEKIKKYSKDCEDFRYNVEEFINFLRKESKKIGLHVYVYPKLVKLCKMEDGNNVTEYNITIRICGSGIEIYRTFNLKFVE